MTETNLASWLTVGNETIDESAHFLGTKGTQPLVIKTNQLVDNSEKMESTPMAP